MLCVHVFLRLGSSQQQAGYRKGFCIFFSVVSRVLSATLNLLALAGFPFYF